MARAKRGMPPKRSVKLLKFADEGIQRGLLRDFALLGQFLLVAL